MALPLNDFYSTEALGTFYRTAQKDQLPFLGKPRFPTQLKGGMDLKWITGKTGTPVQLVNSAFDAEPTLRDRIGIEKIETEMPFFREAMQIKEKDLMELRRCEDANDPYAKPVMLNIYNDAATLRAGADVVRERMIWQLLCPANGDMRIRIVNNNVPYDYLYDVDGGWKKGNYLELAPSEQWTEANKATAKPLKAFDALKKMVGESGGDVPTIAVMSRETYDRMADMEQIRNTIVQHTGIGQIAYQSEDVTNAAVERTTKLMPVVYEKPFKPSASAPSRPYLPDGYVSIFAGSKPLGNFWHGMTPEELAFTGGELADFTKDDGISISKIVLPVIPAKIETVVSMVGMPSFEYMYDVGVMKVF